MSRFRRGTVVIPRERDPVDADAALRALAVAYCRRAEDAGATPEQTLAAVSRVLADGHAAVATRAGNASG
ncbi:hypothetical protein [Pseudonocardia alaniniphila]|uniref:Uncharacterized protein n=1 Tax=Pseudonocardia alaniniphila TaxID=75291 RepID=A0ABS9TQ07_9PSEU|nr:hypothetical protein [Pseudonocardia alaniniphila]MCH6170316.1 hypothetical protein [Pseudonocardia alaniniphila]